MNKTIGFIGGGNMATAIIGGIISSGADASNIFVYDKNPDALEKLNRVYNIKQNSTLVDVCSSDILFLAIKPNVVNSVMLLFL